MALYNNMYKTRADTLLLKLSSFATDKCKLNESDDSNGRFKKHTISFFVRNSMEYDYVWLRFRDLRNLQLERALADDLSQRTATTDSPATTQHPYKLS